MTECSVAPGEMWLLVDADSGTSSRGLEPAERDAAGGPGDLAGQSSRTHLGVRATTSAGWQSGGGGTVDDWLPAITGAGSGVAVASPAPVTVRYEAPTDPGGAVTDNPANCLRWCAWPRVCEDSSSQATDRREGP